MKRTAFVQQPRPGMRGGRIPGGGGGPGIGGLPGGGGGGPIGGGGIGGGKGRPRSFVIRSQTSGKGRSLRSQSCL